MEQAPQAYWALTSDDVLRRFGGDVQVGLTHVEAVQRLADSGANVIREEGRTSAFTRFFSQFRSPVVLILVGAVLLSFFLGEIIDASVIFAILILNAVVGYAQEAKADSAVAALKQRSVPRVRVLREANIVEVTPLDVCPGDILVLEAGDFVAADARLINVHQMASDESVLTGESLPVEKQIQPVLKEALPADQRNMVFCGTTIVRGSGRAVVTSTGMFTQMGQIAGLITRVRTEATPLQKRLEAVSSRLVLFCLLVIVLVAVLGFYHNESFITVLLGAVGLAVAAIPEGLPAVVTLALALAVRRMAGRNAIVRQLAAVETLGSTHVICTDKTGTLTTGKMRVGEVWFEGFCHTAHERLPQSETVDELLKAGILCSNASLAQDGSFTGDPTEVALLILARDQKLDLRETMTGQPRLFEWAFDSERKRMSVAVEKNGRTELYVKGAPESVMALCNLDAAFKIQIENAVKTLSSQGKRLLAVAKKELSGQVLKFHAQTHPSAAEIEQGLNFLGLVAIYDPPRPEAKVSISACRKAGIGVVMITGDHPVTAKSIALDLGIITPDFSNVLTGAEIEKLSDAELAGKVMNTAVYARVSPEHKIRIVRAFKANGKVVAMTGDGVNDAPAIKEASIGIAMGKGGTEVARQASSMILADDNFATIVAAVEEGRAVHGNIRRTIKYLLAGNFGEMIVMLGAAMLGFPIPLLPIHLLWINLVTDGIPALALAAEPVPKKYLETSERSTLDSFKGLGFYQEIIFTGLVTGGMTLAIYVLALNTLPVAVARTFAFSFLVFEELFRSFAGRSQKKTFWQMGVRSNATLVIAVMLTAGIQFVIQYLSIFHEIFRISVLGFQEYLTVIGLALIPVTLLEMKKLVCERFKTR